MKDYYATLQVHPDADVEVIVAAYKRLIRKHQPDTNPGAEAQARAAALNEAYEVLSHPARRAAYERERTRAREWGGVGWLRPEQTIKPEPVEPPAPSPSAPSRVIPLVALGIAVLAVSASVAAALGFWGAEVPEVEPFEPVPIRAPVVEEVAPVEPETEVAPAPAPRPVVKEEPKKKLRLYQPREAEPEAE